MDAWAGDGRRLLDAGHELVLYNRTPDKIADLVAAGAGSAKSAADAARDVDAVITMLANDEVLETVARKDGLIDAPAEAAIHIAMGTRGVGVIRALAEAHAAKGGQLVCARCWAVPRRSPPNASASSPPVPTPPSPQVQPLFDAIGHARPTWPARTWARPAPSRWPTTS